MLAPYLSHQQPLRGSRHPKSAQALHVSVTDSAGAQPCTEHAYVTVEPYHEQHLPIDR